MIENNLSENVEKSVYNIGENYILKNKIHLVKYSFYAFENQIEQIKKISKRTGHSVSDLIRCAVDIVIEKNK